MILFDDVDLLSVNGSDVHCRCRFDKAKALFCLLRQNWAYSSSRQTQ